MRRAPRNKNKFVVNVRPECEGGVQTHKGSRKRTRSTAIPGEERNPLLYRLSLYPYSGGGGGPGKMLRMVYGDEPTYLLEWCVCGIVASFARDRVKTFLRSLAVPRSVLLRLFHRLFLAETYCCSFERLSNECLYLQRYVTIQFYMLNTTAPVN